MFRKIYGNFKSSLKKAIHETTDNVLRFNEWTMNNFWIHESSFINEKWEKKEASITQKCQHRIKFAVKGESVILCWGEENYCSRQDKVFRFEWKDLQTDKILW